jgi:hypothetical protein
MAITLGTFTKLDDGVYAGTLKTLNKTDVNDATWLADLLAHGLIRGSFVPDAQTQQLRALLRTRKQVCPRT